MLGTYNLLELKGGLKSLLSIFIRLFSTFYVYNGEWFGNI
jgi:hypothetical protein